MTFAHAAPGRRARALGLTAAVAGTALLLADPAAGMASQLPSYLFAWLFVLGLSLGSLALLCTHNLTGGAWALPVRPYLEGAAAIIPWVTLMMIPLLLAAPSSFAWMRRGVTPAAAAIAEQAWSSSCSRRLLRRSTGSCHSPRPGPRAFSGC